VAARRVAIIDYGSGNLRSASKAFERVVRERGLDVEVRVTSDADEVAESERIVLPGVGAFGDCMRGIGNLSGMLPALDHAVRTVGKPFLGICVGMQLLAERGFEHGENPGLGWIAGDVVAIAGSNLKVPHMGWNDLKVRSTHPVLKSINTGAHAYFVHSYTVACAHNDNVFASVDYGSPLAAVIGRDNIVGTQFHPEKSQAVGLALLANFLEWRP
jgi:glutamine amidotransferase